MISCPPTSPYRPRLILVRAALMLLATLVLAPPSSSAAAHKSAFKQGLRAMERAEWDWAVVYLQRAVDLKPENVDYRARLTQARQRASFHHFELAKRHLSSGNLEEAIAELQQTVSLNPAHQYAYVELEKALAEWRRLQEVRDSQSLEMERKKREAEDRASVPKLDPSSNVPIQVQLENKPLKEIFTVLSLVSDINIIHDEGVQLDKTASLVTDNVRFEEALDLLMLQQGLAFKVLNQNTILVYQNNQTKQREYEDQLIRTFYLSNADVKEVNAILRSVVDLRKTAVNEQLNAITILDSQDKIAIAGRLIEANDKAKAELIIDLEILEVNRSKLKQYGIDVRTGTNSGINSSIAFDDDQIRLNNLRRLNQLGSYIVSPIPSVILQLLRQDSDTKSLSRPQVRVTDTEKVTLHLGDQVPIPNTTFNTSNTVGSNVVPITSFTYQNVGIQVSLEPRIHHNREITLQLQAEISSVASVSQGGQPTIGTREVETVIRLRDGETNLLAGLFQETDGRSLSGVPGLTDVPLLRRIFGSTRQNMSETEIILTVTPHIVRVPDISVTDLAPMHVGTERDRKLKGESHYGVGGSPFRRPDEKPPQDPFTSLRPGAQDEDASRMVVPDPGLASGAESGARLDPVIITNETLDQALAARVDAEASARVQAATGRGADPGAAPPPEAPAASPQGSGPARPTPPAPSREPPPVTAPVPPPAGAQPSPVSPPPPGGSGSPPQPAPVPTPAPAPAPTSGQGAQGPSRSSGSVSLQPGSSQPPAGSPVPAQPTGPAHLSIRVTESPLRVGQQAIIEVRLDAHGNAVRNVPWHLRFDPALLRAGDPTEGDFFRNAGAASLFLPDVQNGRIIVGHSQFGGSEAVTGQGLLAQIPIEALAPGEVRLYFENVAISDRANEPVATRIDELVLRISR